MNRKSFNLGIISALVLMPTAYAGTGALFSATLSTDTLSIQTTIPNRTYPKCGIKINTPGYSLKNKGTECNMINNGYCLFSANDKTPATITIDGPSGNFSATLCLNGTGPLSCQVFNFNGGGKLPRFAYVANGGNDTVSICPLNADGSLGTCTTSTGNGTFSFGGPGGGAGLGFNTTGTTAYVVNYNNSTVSICGVNSDGTFGTCTATDGNGTIIFPDGNMAVNSNSQTAYIPNCGSGTVSLCPVKADGSFGTCVTSTGSGTFACPTQIVLNKAQTLAYIGNENLTISICPVKGDGTFGTCTTASGNGTFSDTQGVSFNAAQTVLYVGNLTGSTVSICPVNNDGTLGTCTTNSGTPAFNFSDNEVIGLFMSYARNIGYIPNNGNGLVNICPLSTSNGAIGTCTTSSGNGTFVQPTAVFLN